MKSLSGKTTTYDGNTYTLQNNGVIYPDGILYITATQPGRSEYLLEYQPQRSVNISLDNEYELSWGEFELGNTAHTITVNSRELDYVNVYTLQDVKEK